MDIESIRERVPLADLVGEVCGELRQVGRNFVTCCPFHGESTPSFYVMLEAGREHCHCFGCGWHGDVFAFWGAVSGLGFAGAAKSLTEKFAIYGALDESVTRTARPPLEKAPKVDVRPDCPRFRRLRTAEIRQLAALRELDPLAVRVAAEDFGRVGFCEWPQWRGRDGAWRPGSGVGPAWVITDAERWVVQYRRMDGAPYVMRRKDGSASELKAWTKGAAKWPVGCMDMGDRRCVLLVEGGADILAGYHFLWGFGLLDQVAVVGMLGGSRMREDALGCFAGKRVRIPFDADPPKLDSRGVPRRTGMETALRWQRQLTAAGAAVETFSLEGLQDRRGAGVKDLNDLARATAQTLNSDEIGELFFAWDF